MDKPSTLGCKNASGQTSACATIYGYLAGITYCLLWFFSILAGFFVLICPAIPLAVVAPKLFRRWTDIVFGMWEPFPVAMMEMMFNVRIVITGDKIDPNEGSLIIMNHRTRLDWNFLWAAFYHNAPPLNHSLKFILKADIMHIPGPGWVMQACSFLFIKRHWDTDQALLANSLNHLRDTDYPCQILLFPEGTDLTARSIDKSNQYADKNGFNRYYRVLHPKTTGFAYLVNKMRKNGQLQAVYDLTIAYPRTLPETECDLLRGRFPEELHFNVVRHASGTLPYSEAKLKQWLMDKWRQKEQELHRFYSYGCFTNQDGTPDCAEQNNANELLKTKRDPTPSCKCSTFTTNPALTTHFFHNSEVTFMLDDRSGTPEDVRPKEPPVSIGRCHRLGSPLFLALIFWIGIVVLFFYNILFSSFMRIWVAYFSLVFILFSIVSNGFNQVIATKWGFRCGVEESSKKSE